MGNGEEMNQISVIKDAGGDCVVVSEIAAFVGIKSDYEVTLKSGVKILLKEKLDGELEANLHGQFTMYFGE